MKKTDGKRPINSQGPFGRIYACKRCQDRHTKCEGDPSEASCNACKKAKCPCEGRTKLVFRLNRYKSGRQSKVKRLLGGKSKEDSLLLHEHIEAHASSSDAITVIARTDPLACESFENANDALDGDPSLPSQEDGESSEDFGTANSVCPRDMTSSHGSSHERIEIVENWNGESPILPSVIAGVFVAASPRNAIVTPSPVYQVLEPQPTIIEQAGDALQNGLNQPSDSILTLQTAVNQSIWPLRNENEAFLFKHFVNNLAAWFDHCDPKNHFRQYVVRTASSDPTVFYAVLATAARHRSVTKGIDCHLADEYQRRCLETLIPAITNETIPLKETIFASAIILRLLEEMTEPSDRESKSSHTLSAALLMRIRQGTIHESTFSDAALMVALRQEIFVANMTRRPVEPIADYCNIDYSLEPTSDAMWTYRILAHSAAITNYAYTPGIRTLERWNELLQYTLGWSANRPTSFLPTYQPPDRQEGFPEIWYSDDCYVAAHQYLLLCHILLLVCNPQAPLLGLGVAKYRKKRDDEVKTAARMVCGIAMSNPEYAPAQSVAALVVGMCGELFDDPEDQRALLCIVSEAESHLVWPSLKVKDRLMAYWGLS